MLTRRSLIPVVLVLASLQSLLASGASAQPSPSTATAIRVNGRVEVLGPRGSRWAPLTQGASVQEGSQVRSFAGGSAELTLPDSSTVIVGENTRYALIKIAVDPGTGYRDIATHLVVGKIVARVKRAAVQLARTRGDNFTISTPAGVAAVRGTVAVVAFDPATNTALLFVLPSPGESPQSARVSYVDLATGTSRVVAGGGFVSHVAGQLPSQPIPISTLPSLTQQQVTAATNDATANSGALTQTTVVLVSTETIQQALVVLSQPSGGSAPDSGAPASGTPSSTGRDVLSGPLATSTTCATPPCP